MIINQKTKMVKLLISTGIPETAIFALAKHREGIVQLTNLLKDLESEAYAMIFEHTPKNISLVDLRMLFLHYHKF